MLPLALMLSFFYVCDDLCLFHLVKARDPLVNPGLDLSFMCICQQLLIYVSVRLIKRNVRSFLVIC